MSTEAVWPNLRLGSTGADVTALQYLLRGKRDQWRSLTADGVFGEATDSVVRGFQDIYDVPPVDGIVGSATWARLIEGTTVLSGSQGEYVRAAQTELLKHGDLASGQVDGVFGATTDAATRTFQKSVGLGVDGIVGPETWHWLIGS